MRHIVVLVVLVVVVVLSGAARADAPPSPLVYPMQHLPLSFSHADHLRLGGVGCGTCHEDAAGSTRAADVLLPKEESCTGCHEIDRAEPEKQATPPARCDACHSGLQPGAPVERALVPAPNLKFNHQLHMGQKIACASCHDVAGVGLATRNQLPKMALCLGCHDGQKATSACIACHPAGVAGRVQTDLPDGKLIPSGNLRGDAHDLRFRTEHARVAQNDERYCGACHARDFCQDCHTGIVKPLDIHGSDYVLIHAVDARRQATNCQACHRLQTFCTGCHSRSGVGDDSKTSAFQRQSQAPPGEQSSRPFHPNGSWTTNEKDLRGASHHSFQAQRNMTQCVSCHRESFCMECHSTRGTGVAATHPPGWESSAGCRALAAKAKRTCLRCHPDGAPRCD